MIFWFNYGQLQEYFQDPLAFYFAHHVGWVGDALQCFLQQFQGRT